jgi:predicted dehydrogenase
LDWTLWQGPATRQDYHRNYVHYNWHWFWHYGNGETGNQGVHQMDLAVWGLNKGYPTKVYSSGGRYVWNDQGETPNTQITTFTYGDDAVLEFEVRNIGSYQEAGKTTGNHFLGAEGYYVEGQGFFDYDHNPIPVDEEYPDTKGPWGNFVEAVKSRNQSDIHGTAAEGHASCVHCHLANAAYRMGRALEFDGKNERFTDRDANKLIRDDYAKGFEVPDLA